MELVSLSLEEGAKELRPKLVLKLVSLRLGCNEDGSASAGKLLAGFSRGSGRELPVLQCSARGGWYPQEWDMDRKESPPLPQPCSPLLESPLGGPDTDEVANLKGGLHCPAAAPQSEAQRRIGT